MEDLVFDNDTTLSPPDDDGDVVVYKQGESCSHLGHVPFELLEKWVASIKEQIITSSNEQATICPTCGHSTIDPQFYCDNCHGDLPPVG